MLQRSAFHSAYRLFSVIFLLALIISSANPDHVFTVHAQSDAVEIDPIIVDSRFRAEPLLGTFDVQRFLENRSSPLAASLVSGKDGRRVKASSVISDISLKFEIAPQVILVLMQIGSGIVDTNHPSTGQLKSPLGSQYRADWRPSRW